MNGPTYDNCLFAAKNVLNALEQIGEPWACLVGGMAARLYGVRRETRDLDIVIIQPEADERSIQLALVQRFPTEFFLRRPKDHTATFMKLYYSIPRTVHSIKVDLLLSTNPILEIPTGLHPNHLQIINGLRVAPLYFVLYHKLFGWDLRLHSGVEWQQDRANDQDYFHIVRLCDRAYQLKLLPLSKVHMGESYLNKFQTRARSFAAQYGRRERRLFRRLGFPL